jgi:hypothetical protein
MTYLPPAYLSQATAGPEISKKLYNINMMAIFAVVLVRDLYVPRTDIHDMVGQPSHARAVFLGDLRVSGKAL